MKAHFIYFGNGAGMQRVIVHVQYDSSYRFEAVVSLRASTCREYVGAVEAAVRRRHDFTQREVCSVRTIQVRMVPYGSSTPVPKKIQYVLTVMKGVRRTVLILVARITATRRFDGISFLQCC